MTVEEFERATEQDLRKRANQLFEDAGKVGELVRTALLTEARFYLDEIDRRDDKFRSRRDLGLEIVVIGLITIEIIFSVIAFYEGKAQFNVLSNLEASSRATASTLVSLQQISDQTNKAMQEQLELSYEVAVSVHANLPDNRLEITNEGRTRLVLFGAKIGVDPAAMQHRPSILAPGAPTSIATERINSLIQEQINRPPRTVSIPVVLFLKNEKGEEFVARYLLLSGVGYGPLSLHTQTIAVTKTTWSKKVE